MQGAVAQSAGDGASFLTQYPRGSIKSVLRADQALIDAPKAQAAQELAFQANRQRCYQKLVAEGCLREAIEANAKIERGIRAIEVEARDFKRHESERESKAAKDGKLAREAAEAPRRAAEREQSKAGRKAHEERNARMQREFEAGAPERARRAAEEKRRLDDKMAARAKKDAEERANAAARAQRARDHEEKVRTVLLRAKEKEAKEARAKAGKGGSTKKPTAAPLQSSTPIPVVKQEN